MKIFYKESHTQYFTKFLDFFVFVVFQTCLYKIEQQKKGQIKEMAPVPHRSPEPEVRGQPSQVGDEKDQTQPGLDSYLMGIVLSAFLFLNLKYILIFLYMFDSFLFLYSPLST